MTSTADLVAGVRAGLRALADPERAVASQAYLTTTEPMLGVRLPLVRQVVAAHPAADLATTLAVAEQLWGGASFREERYAAQAHLRRPVARGRIEVLPLVTAMITTGAWWDLVDECAHVVCAVLQEHRAAVTPVLREWAVADDRWLRRSAVIAQLDARDATDTDLLTAAVEANVDDPDFFLRKAIGWALRQYARTDPAWVRAFVDDHPDLSPLSRREALKHL